MLSDPRMDFASTVVLETEGDAPALGGPLTGPVDIQHVSSDEIRVQVAAPAPMVLVLAHTDYPGWEAELDGKAVPILRANVLFRAVVVPAGDHTVRFRYRPDSARQGAVGPLLFLLLGLGAAFWRPRRAA